MVHILTRATVARTTVFHNNETQAVRLPRAVALPEGVTAVDVTVVGEARVITPAGRGWDFWWDHGPAVSDDFLADRDQSEPQERESL
jgi:antitoxin VapB